MYHFSVTLNLLKTVFYCCIYCHQILFFFKFSVCKCELYHEVSYMARFAVGQNVTLVNFMWDEYFKQDSDERRVMNEEIEKLKTEKNVLMVCII